MKINNNSFKLWLSKNETYNWAHRINNSWPCSQLSGNRLFVEFSKGNLIDIAINGKTEDCDNNELCAIVADFVTSKGLEFNH
jgi:hypothetical protein